MLALLVATLCLGAQSQPGEDMWQSIRDSIDAFADVPATTIFIGSDDQGVVFNYTKGMLSSANCIGKRRAGARLGQSRSWPKTAMSHLAFVHTSITIYASIC